MEKNTDLRKKIIALVEETLNLQEGAITEDTCAVDVEQWDSLAQVMIIGELEEKMGIAIPLDEAVEITGMKELLESAERYAG